MLWCQALCTYVLAVDRGVAALFFQAYRISYTWQPIAQLPTVNMLCNAIALVTCMTMMHGILLVQRNDCKRHL